MHVQVSLRRVNSFLFFNVDDCSQFAQRSRRGEREGKDWRIGFAQKYKLLYSFFFFFLLNYFGRIEEGRGACARSAIFSIDDAADDKFDVTESLSGIPCRNENIFCRSRSNMESESFKSNGAFTFAFRLVDTSLALPFLIFR